MKIEIMGPGCPRCQATKQNVHEALQELGTEAEVEHLYDVKEYAKRGVMFTPAVAIDGKTVVQGKVPEVSELTSIFASELERVS